MSVEDTGLEPVTVDVDNIGGIDHATVTVSPGVTVLAGRNATNRTSFLRGIMAALGSDDVSIKADADEAAVELTIGGETYTRTLERASGTIRTGGDPYLDDPLLADLFAFLLEANEARRAVSTDDDLRELIMRPIDTEEIHTSIDRLVERRRELTSELDGLESLKGRLPALEEKRTRLASEIESTEAELAEAEAALAAHDAGVEKTRDEQDELESKLSELREERANLEDVRYELETERGSLESLRTEQDELAATAEELPDAPMGKLDDVESRIERLRNRKGRLETEINELQGVIQFNEELLEGSTSPFDGDLEVFDDSTGIDGGDTVTDQLLQVEETTTCWTCGSEVAAEQIERTVEQLREHSQSKFGTLRELNDELSELKDRRRELEDQQRERDRIERRHAELDDEIEATEERIETLSERRDELREAIAAREAEIEALEDDSHQEILDLHREANQYEYDLGRLEGDLESVESEIEEIEERLDRQADIEAEREAVSDELEELRTKIESIERTAIEEFNEHMITVLDRLDYRNVERVWLERTETSVRDGRGTTRKSTFDLHIVRQTEDGTSFEDTIDHLSESEREVVGLIFALAGYLVHDVYEEVPFLLLDSLEAIDSARIASLVEYLNAYSPYLVVALLEEDAAALGDDCERVEMA